ncbi:MAG: hypothetical protein HY481_01930 [Candidatus Vogelbacteria bacterium]|nr:hypothetical protein [Candidatus Vogelbacteria bacterium]
MFKRILVVLLVLGFLFPLSSSAQTASEIAKLIAELSRQIAELKVKLAQLQGQSGSQQWCHTFERNLGVGSGGKDVDALHEALVKEGISISPMPVPVNTTLSELEKDKEKSKATFTEATAAAVSAFQLKYKDEILTPLGLMNPTGYVGPSTRAKLNKLYGCKYVITPIPIPPDKPSLTVVSPNGGESWQKGTDQLIQWSWGTNTFVGQQFTIYLNPIPTPCPIPMATTGITTTCEVTPQWKIVSGIAGTSYYKWEVGKTTSGIPPAGVYYIQVCAPTNYGGYVCDQSDSYFKIYDSDQTGNRPPSISGVSGPTALKIGETGTWTVQASDPENGSLSYSVIWGDEQMMASGGVAAAPTIEKVQQTATFTHSYAQAGTYYPKFKVTDNAGQSNGTSLSVVIGTGSVTNQPPKIMSGMAPSTVAVGQKITLAWTAYDPDGDKLSLSMDWGDGTGASGACLVSPVPQGIFGSQTLSDSHAWLSAGIYTVTATVYDCRGGEAKTSLKIQVGPLVSSVQVLSPNGGESWTKGNTYTISWGATGAPEVSVYLVRDSDPTSRLAIRHNFVSGRANSITWTVRGDSETGDIPAGSDYRIWVIGGGATAVEDKSDAPFKIVSQ